MTEANRMDAQRALRALVIDDDELVRETIVAILKSVNLDVIAASDGEEGLQLFESDPTDLVITDILMPNKEGIETITELRARDSDVKILAISGGGQVAGQEHLKLAEKMGADRTLPKPFTPQQVITIVSELLQGLDAAP